MSAFRGKADILNISYPFRAPEPIATITCLNVGAAMRRREFITFVGSAAAWPFAVSAQQRAQMRRIGVLMGLDANDPDVQSGVTALKRGLQELGWAEGRNLEIKYNWTGGAPDRVQSSAKELVERQCEVI